MTGYRASRTRRRRTADDGAFDHAKPLAMRPKLAYEELLGIVNNVLSQAEGSDWPAVATRLSPYMAWEFEDYRA
jgi:hypothetical protein